MSHTPSSSSEPSILLPVLAIVFFVVFWPLGVILSIVAIVKFQGAKGTTAKTLSIIALVLNVVLAVPMCGIVAAIAIPNFVKFQCRSKQSEAKGNLKALFVAEASHHGEADSYSSDLSTIGFTPRGERIRYEYVVVEAGKDSFRAEARGTSEMAGDLWVIDQENTLKNVDNVCAR